MGKSIGLLELKSIPVGIATADEMLKAANVSLLLATPICPGKYVILISGDIGAVKSSVERGEEMAGSYLITCHKINNVHDDLPSAIAGTTDVPSDVQAVGAIETMSALTAIIAADTAVKASDVHLIEVRIARGLGGKGYLLLTGEVSSVKEAIEACTSSLESTGDITSTCVIPSIDKALFKALL